MQDKSIREFKVLCDLIKVMYFLQAGHHLYIATLSKECAKSVTIKEAEGTADLINFFFPDREVSPMEFMKSIDETVNEAIQSYNEYKKWLDKFPGNKRVLEGFCKWYASCRFEASNLKLNCPYIIFIADALLSKRSGFIDDYEFKALMNHSILTRNQFFYGYQPKSVARDYFKVRDKIKEIEKKVKRREAYHEIDYSNCPF